MLLMSWFRKSSTKTAFDWQELTSEEQFLNLLEQQNQFAVFKHSTRCSISSMAKNRLENNWDIDDSTPIYYLDLIRYRNISNLIADKLNVEHQSPQLILIRNGEAIYNASHNGIDVEALKKVI
ncbi:MAG: bacillithiol system redox-active protein YtxJ [Bacteroidetes bacterium]|nr:bacillithiol system redox-active protein YtxJ [Bacteroidota bacterium]